MRFRPRKNAFSTNFQSHLCFITCIFSSFLSDQGLLLNQSDVVPTVKASHILSYFAVTFFPTQYFANEFAVWWALRRFFFCSFEGVYHSKSESISLQTCYPEICVKLLCKKVPCEVKEIRPKSLDLNSQLSDQEVCSSVKYILIWIEKKLVRIRGKNVAVSLITKLGWFFSK